MSPIKKGNANLCSLIMCCCTAEMKSAIASDAAATNSFLHLNILLFIELYSLSALSGQALAQRIQSTERMKQKHISSSSSSSADMDGDEKTYFIEKTICLFASCLFPIVPLKSEQKQHFAFQKPVVAVATNNTAIPLLMKLLSNLSNQASSTILITPNQPPTTKLALH